MKKNLILTGVLVLSCALPSLAEYDERIYEIQYNLCGDRNCLKGVLYSWGEPESIKIRQMEPRTSLASTAFGVTIESKGCFPQMLGPGQKTTYITPLQIRVMSGVPTFQKLSSAPASDKVVTKIRAQVFVTPQMPGGRGRCQPLK